MQLNIEVPHFNVNVKSRGNWDNPGFPGRMGTLRSSVDNEHETESQRPTMQIIQNAHLVIFIG